MTTGDNSTMVVVVTYGDRSDMCIRVVSEALRQGSVGCVLVSNGCRGDALTALQALAGRDARVVLLEEDVNMGSAPGFARGMKLARATRPATFLWLLDDDNMPLEGALGALQRAARATGDKESPGAVFARREDSEVHQKALRGGRDAFPPPGSYLYFDLRQRLARWRRTDSLLGVEPRTVAVPYGPYGGLLLPAAACDAIGYPNEELVLYEDDTEYTARFPSAGFSVILTASACIKDLEANWLRGVERRGPGRLLANSSRSKTYFSVRNRTHFDRLRARGQLGRFLVNIAVYWVSLMCSCRSGTDLRRLGVVWTATVDGLRGNLGPRDHAPLA